MSASSLRQVVPLGGIGDRVEQLAGVGDVLLRDLRHSSYASTTGLQLLLPPPCVSGRAAITRGVDAGQVGLEPIELFGERSELFEHRFGGYRPRSGASPAIRIHARARFLLKVERGNGSSTSGRYGLGTDALPGTAA